MNNTLQTYLSGVSWDQVAYGALKIILILALAKVALGVARKVLEKLAASLTHGDADEKNDNAQRVTTLMALFQQVLSVTVWALAFVVVLDTLTIDIRPILAGAGVIGLAIGFGAQNLVRDTISGLFIILENQIAVGDVAVVNGTGGLVEEINLRTVVLRDLEGTVHIFPSGTITTLANKSSGWAAAVFDIGVAYHEDVDKVIEVMGQVAKELQEDEEFGPKIIADMEIFGLDQFADSALVIKARLKTKPLKQWEVGRAYKARLKKAFDREGIEIPFPYRTLTLAKGEDFLAKALNGGPNPAAAKS